MKQIARNIYYWGSFAGLLAVLLFAEDPWVKVLATALIMRSYYLEDLING